MSLQRFITSIDHFTEAVGRVVSWCALLLVLTVTVDVGLRYCFDISFVATRELEWQLFSLIFLLGAPYTLKHNAHVRVDVFYQRLPVRLRAAVNLAGFFLFLLPGCYLIITTALPFVQRSWMILEGSPNPGGLPGRYIIKAILPLSFALLALQGIAFFCHNLQTLLHRTEGKVEER